MAELHRLRPVHPAQTERGLFIRLRRSHLRFGPWRDALRLPPGISRLSRCGPGQIIIECADLPRARAFYERIIGLRRLPGRYPDGAVHFRVANLCAGQPEILVLMPRQCPGTPQIRISVTLPVNDLNTLQARLDSAGKGFHGREINWIGWRGVVTSDPEGNVLELVAQGAARA